MGFEKIFLNETTWLKQNPLYECNIGSNGPGDDGEQGKELKGGEKGPAQGVSSGGWKMKMNHKNESRIRFFETWIHAENNSNTTIGTSIPTNILRFFAQTPEINLQAQRWKSAASPGLHNYSGISRGPQSIFLCIFRGKRGWRGKAKQGDVSPVRSNGFWVQRWCSWQPRPPPDPEGTIDGRRDGWSLWLAMCSLGSSGSGD